LAFRAPDFAKETSIVVGTGNVTVLGARAPGQTLSVAGLIAGDTFDYAISHQTLNEWEVGRGTMLSATSFSRSPTASSNGGALVAFSIGTKSVDVVLPSVRIGQLLGPLQIGATTLGRGTVIFSNGGGVSFGLSTDSNGGTVTASVGSASSLFFSNLNGHTFGTAGSTVTVSADAFRSISLTDPGAGTNGVSVFSESTITGPTISMHLMATSLNDQYSFLNVQFRAAGANRLVAMATQLYLAGTTFAKAQNLSFQDQNGVSFGFNFFSNTFANFGLIPGITASFEPRLGLVSQVGGSSVLNATRLVFSNTNGITFGISTGANAATVTASVGAGGAAGSIAVPGTTFALGQLVFSNSNGIGFGINGSTLTASSALTVSASNGTYSATALSFSTNGRVNFSTTAGSQIVATCNVAISAGTGFFLLSNFKFQDVPGLSWNLGGTVITATPLNSGLHVASDSANSVNFSLLHFANSNGMSLGISTGASAATVTGSFSSLSFSNLNGVTFGIAGSTLTASVNAGGGGGIAASAAGNSVSNGTVVWSNSNGVSFGMAGSTVTASIAPSLLVSHIGGTSVSNVASLVFSNAFNVNWLVSSAAGGATIQASAVEPVMSGIEPFQGAMLVNNQYGQNSLVLAGFTAPAFQFDRLVHPIEVQVANVTAQGTHSVSLRVGLYTRNASTLSLAGSTSFTFSLAVSSTTQNSTAWSGMRMVSFPWTSTFPDGNYWMGVLSSTASAGASAISFSIRNGMYSQTLSVFSGYLNSNNGTATNNTIQLKLGQGYYSASTGALPASIGFSQIFGPIAAGNSAANRSPAFFFLSGTA
jgi:hypothetical protein